MARFNFLQPMRRKYWPNTLGIALQPLALTDRELREHLDFQPNSKRRPYFDVSRPYYFVDCDIGAVLFLAVGVWTRRKVGRELKIARYLWRFAVSRKLTIVWIGNYRRSRQYEAGLSR